MADQVTPVPKAEDKPIVIEKPESGFLARNWKYVSLIVVLIGWGAREYQAYQKGEPISLPPINPADYFQPVKADELATPVNYEGQSYHNDHVHDGEGQIQKIESNGKRWPTNRLPYFVNYSSVSQLRPALSNEAVSGAFRQAWGWWSESLEIEPVEVSDPSQALVTITFDRIDGTNGTLAESYLADGTMRPKGQRYDASERWTVGPPASGLLSLPTVACHEIGHVLGLGHDDPTAPAVMRPVYSSALPREQARDIDRMAQLGYKKRAKSPTPPTDLLTFPVQAKTDDVIDALRKIGITVTKP